MNQTQTTSPTTATKWLEKPIFVLGFSKSGTSLLVGILDNHPQLVVLPEESDYFDLLFQQTQQLAEKNNYTKAQKIDHILQIITQRTHLRNLSRGQVDEYIGGNFDYQTFDATTFKNSLQNYLEQHDFNQKNILKAMPYAFRQASGLQYEKIAAWVEKTPYHQKFVYNRIAKIEEMFSDYRTIHIIRDPRDNYLAYKKKWSHLTVENFCFEWKRVFDISLKLKDNPNNLTIRYEDLVSRPTEVLTQITDFLGIRYADALEQPSKYGNAWHGNSMFGEKHTKISPKNLGRFRKLDDQSAVAKVEYLLRQEMQTMGYKPELQNARKKSLISPKLSYQINILKRNINATKAAFIGKIRSEF